MRGLFTFVRKMLNFIHVGKNLHIGSSRISSPELLHPSVKVINSFLSGKIHIEKHSIIKDCFLFTNELYIGRNTSLWGPNIDVYSMLNPVKIGSFCSVARNVSIQEYEHRMDRCSTYFFSSNVFGEGMEQDIASKGPISIGNDVWIASHVVIGSGANIGDGAVIGANSVVVGNVPPYAVAVGSPARVVKYRFDERLITQLLEIRWWEWEDERIKQNRELFLNPLTSDSFDRIT